MYEAILSDIALGVNYIELAILMELFGYFIYYYFFREEFENKKKDPLLLTTSFAFFAFAASRVCYIIFDYYFEQNLLVIFAWTFRIGGLILIFYGLFSGKAMASVFKEFPNRALYIIAVAILISMGILFRFMGNLLWIMPILLGVGVGILVPPIIQFNRWISKVGGHLKNLRWALLAIPIAFLGLLIGPNWKAISLIWVELGWLIKITGHLLLLSGFILFAITIFGLPSFEELGWEKNMRNIYVIMPNGSCIYNFSFTESKILDADLLGGSLTGIIDIVQEMSQSEQKMKLIRQESNNLFIEYGRLVNVVIIAEKDLKIIFDKIAEFRNEFETLFKNRLENFDGNIDIFKLSDILIKKVFPTVIGR